MSNVIVTLYGIKNCDAVKKARRWCQANNIDVQFHDFQVDALDELTITQWLKSVSWQTLLNKRSTTWRQLADPRKEQLNQTVAVELMLKNPTLIKRPVLCDNSGCMVGFKEADYTAKFAK